MARYAVYFAHAFAAGQCPIPLPDVQLLPIGDFLALRPSESADASTLHSIFTSGQPANP